MKMKKSIFSRSMNLAVLGVKMGLKELQSGNIQSRIDQARLLTQSLAQLKGAAMKAGQLISLELVDYFPPEASKILSQLQNQATSIPFEEIRQILINELGTAQLSQLTSMEETPVASASIAQIHRAQWQDQSLALKIQHPGIADSIESDLSIFKKIAGTFCKLTQREMDLTPLFDELKEVLLQEVDFIKEAEFLKIYQTKIESIVNHRDFYFVPKVMDPFTTKKVLAMSWEDGINLSQWILQKPSEEHRLQLAHLMLNLYCHEFFSWGMVQTDPNFSNFLVREREGEIGLVLLDFGSTRQYEEGMIQQYRELLISVKSGETQRILDSAISFGLIDKRESEESTKLFIEMMNIAIEPFFIQEKDLKIENKIFDFSSSDYSVRSQNITREFSKSLKYSPPPHRILFLHRKLGGIFALLKRLSIKMDVSPYWDKMINLK